MNNLSYVARSERCPERCTLTDLLAEGLVPGLQGVIVEQRSIVFSDIWTLSKMIGAEVSLTKDMVDGRPVFRVRSGTRFDAPITKPRQGLLRILAHTHPSGSDAKLPSARDIHLLNDLFLYQLRHRADASLPHSRVIHGAGLHDYTIFWPSILR